ncbi:MAG: hypothetical protein ACPGMR_13655 [Pontibacterium sp.]
MNKRPSKSELREQLKQGVDAFVEQGGEIEQVAAGESGLQDGRYNPRSFGFDQGPQTRTPVPEVLAAIDSRKKGDEQAKPKKGRRHKKLIYDDFGDPLRWVWVED